MKATISYRKFEFQAVANEVIPLPPYKGSSLRGGLGYVLKDLSCLTKQENCEDCQMKEKCSYSYIFETPVPSNTKIMRKYEKAPHPFILSFPLNGKTSFQKGEDIKFQATLIGKGLDYLPLFILAFKELGKRGIGKKDGCFQLEQVNSDAICFYRSGDYNSHNLYPKLNKIVWEENHSKFTQAEMTIRFMTPTRLFFASKLIMVPEFHVLIRNLLRRLSLLYYFHCNGNSKEWPFTQIINAAQHVRIKCHSLKWYDLERFSGRQNARIKMGGFIDKITYQGKLDPFLSIIKAGEIVHIGKGTSLGLGKMKICH